MRVNTNLYSSGNISEKGKTGMTKSCKYIADGTVCHYITKKLLNIPENNTKRSQMKEEQDASTAEQPQEESKVKKYLRYFFLILSGILFVALFIAMIARKCGS